MQVGNQQRKDSHLQSYIMAAFPHLSCVSLKKDNNLNHLTEITVFMQLIQPDISDCGGSSVSLVVAFENQQSRVVYVAQKQLILFQIQWKC